MKGTLVLIALAALLSCAFGARECYFCIEDCDDPSQIARCTSINDQCYFAHYSVVGLIKGCVKSEIADTYCERIAANLISETACYTCSGDRCNDHIQD